MPALGASQTTPPADATFAYPAPATEFRALQVHGTRLGDLNLCAREAPDHPPSGSCSRLNTRGRARLEARMTRHASFRDDCQVRTPIDANARTACGWMNGERLNEERAAKKLEGGGWNLESAETKSSRAMSRAERQDKTNAVGIELEFEALGKISLVRMKRE
ncbi:hypothetical protein B0H19DRAFT_1227246 [Mycena capillaripes]|nr:hypothetical protein B0H19DRAFT_1227246 [Mycena capillaripes]